MSWVPGNKPDYFLNQGMAVVEEMEALFVSEDVPADAGIRHDVAVMRKEIEEVLAFWGEMAVIEEKERLEREATEEAEEEREAKRAKTSD